MSLLFRLHFMSRMAVLKCVAARFMVQRVACVWWFHGRHVYRGSRLVVHVAFIVILGIDVYGQVYRLIDNVKYVFM